MLSKNSAPYVNLFFYGCRSSETTSTRSSLFPISFPLFWTGVYFNVFDPPEIQLQRCPARENATVYWLADGFISRGFSSSSETWKGKNDCTNRNKLIIFQHKKCVFLL